MNLKPCPFCGGAPKRREIVEHYDADDEVPESGSLSVWFRCECDDCNIGVGCESETDAIEAWNRRATDSTIADLVKALEPFDAILDIFEQPAGCRPKSGDIMSWEDHRVGKRDLTVEMLRTARAALLKARGETK